MAYREVLAKVLDEISEDYLIGLTREVTKIPSVHGNEYAIGEAFYSHMSDLGLDVQKQHVEDNRFNVLATIKGVEDPKSIEESGVRQSTLGRGRSGRSLMFNGHMDTVQDLLGWTKEPYGGVLEDGKIYGHGVSNMKASDTAMVYAMNAIKRANIPLKRDLMLALVVGECHGGVGTKALMKSGIRAETFLCTEPTDLNVLTVHAYSQYFRVNIIGRTGHFGTHDHGLNAVMKMFELTQGMGPMHTEIKPGGWMRFTENVHHHGLPRYHLGTIHAGLTREFREGPSNTPDFCSAIFNIRTPPSKSMRSTKDDIERLLEQMRSKEPGFQYEIDPIREMLGFQAPERSVAVESASRAYVDVCGHQPAVGAIQPYMFMASDSGHMQAAGMADGALIGPGRFTSSVADEYVEVSKLVTGAKIFAAAALRICGYVE
jgi:acetylornithine deacetylase